MSYTIELLPVDKTVTVYGQYTVTENDLSSNQLVNIITGTTEDVEQKTAQAIAQIDTDHSGTEPEEPDEPVETPKTESDFAQMSWNEVKELADACAEGDKSYYEHMLGWSKSVDVSGYGTVNVILKALNNKGKTAGGLAGFTFEADKLLTSQMQDSLTNRLTLWSGSQVRSLLNGTIYNALPSDLKTVIAEVNNPCITSACGGDNSPDTTMVSDKCWIPSHKEVFGDAAGGTNGLSVVPNEGTQFDWYVIHNTEDDRIKNQLNGTLGNWWLRTPFRWSYSYGFRMVSTKGAATYTTSNAEYYPPLCFCI